MPGLSRFSDEEIKRMNRLKFKEGKVTVPSCKLSIATDQAIDSARHVAYEHRLFEEIERGRVSVCTSVNSDFLRLLSSTLRSALINCWHPPLSRGKNSVQAADTHLMMPRSLHRDLGNLF